MEIKLHKDQLSHQANVYMCRSEYCLRQGNPATIKANDTVTLLEVKMTYRFVNHDLMF